MEWQLPCSMVVETTAGSLKEEEEVMSVVLPPKDIEMESSAPFHSSEVMDENTVPQFVAQNSELESESRGVEPVELAVSLQSVNGKKRRDLVGRWRC